MRRYEKYKDSGVEWIGEIPEHWGVKKLNYCFNLIGSGTTPTAGNQEYYEYGEYYWLQTGDLSDSDIYDTSKKITKAAIKDYTTLKIYPINSLIIAMYGATIGKTGILKIESTTNQACCVLSNSNEIHYKYGFYWLNTVKPHIISLSYGGGQPNINQEQIRCLKIQVPLIEEQTAIATYLDQKTAEIDALITDKKRLMELYEEEKSAIINEAVTKGLASTGLASTGLASTGLASTGSAAPGGVGSVLDESAAGEAVLMKDSGIEWMGEIPAHWEVKRLRHVAKVQTGCTPLIQNSEIDYFENGTINWYTPSDFHSNDELKISKRQINKKAVEDGQVILFPEYSIYLVSIGATLGKVSFTKETASANQQINVITFYETMLNPIFGYFFFIANRENIKLEADYTTLPILNQSKAKNLLLACPPVEEQKEIVQYIEAETQRIDTKKERTQKLIDLLTEYRTALISEVVTGKVKVV
jgi:type I restriction enzyme S subunit